MVIRKQKTIPANFHCSYGDNFNAMLTVELIAVKLSLKLVLIGIAYSRYCHRTHHL